MRSTPLLLINGNTLDLVPARVMRARAVGLQRLLAASDWLLRRKSDGRFLAVGTRRNGSMRWRWLASGYAGPLASESSALARRAATTARNPAPRPRPRQPCVADPLDLDLAHYAERTGLTRVHEPAVLAFAGFDRYRRVLWLDNSSAKAWSGMRSAALRDGVILEAISGFRSREYQLGIFRRKQARGQLLSDILAVNAAPGFSEHHSGRALDVGTPGEPAAEESFEATPAFAWLVGHASRFGFAMSYPRGNPHGITYEPWHWMWHAHPGAGNAT